ncbi:MAG: transglycosylase SLT domain-containing protein [Candidatus Limnocylindrales bacterium]
MSAGRRSAVVATLILTATLVLTVLGPAASAAKAPPGLAKFMYAVGKVESGGNYKARNSVSGAYGKYQIMPSNWPSWAKAYLGNSSAKQTPANQERVAAGKFTSLYRSLDSWRRVAYWWLTGSKQTAGWSGYATTYVNKVMRLYRQAGGTDTAPAPKAKAGKHFGEGSSAIAYSASWKSARHQGYAGDKVRYATKAGATATLTFTGRKVTWYGPTGPTRGKARVYLDGVLSRTVDLHARTFDVRDVVFRKTWSSAGTHTLTIEVVGTKGHPMVAIDEFVVTP